MNTLAQIVDRQTCEHVKNFSLKRARENSKQKYARPLKSRRARPSKHSEPGKLSAVKVTVLSTGAHVNCFRGSFLQKMTVSDVFLTIMPINHIIKFANISLKLTGGKILKFML